MQYAKIRPDYDLNRLVDKWGFEKWGRQYLLNLKWCRVCICSNSGECSVLSNQSHIPQIIIDLALDGAFIPSEDAQ